MAERLVPSMVAHLADVKADVKAATLVVASAVRLVVEWVAALVGLLAVLRAVLWDHQMVDVLAGWSVDDLADQWVD